MNLLRPVAEVAPDLIGCLLCRRLGSDVLKGAIVETEAYASHEDPASHAHRGATPRNRSMFGPPGRAYVYFIYGNHFCLNVVAHPEGAAGAVLLRALEPLEGLEQMRALRGEKPDRQLCSGPGKLCQALKITRELDGCDLLDPSGPLWLEPGAAPSRLGRGPRIGIQKAADLPWRFWAHQNPHVSRAC